MTKIAYMRKKFGVESLQRIMVASNIINEYAAKAVASWNSHWRVCNAISEGPNLRVS
jgi:hypothetical protein